MARIITDAARADFTQRCFCKKWNRLWLLLIAEFAGSKTRPARRLVVGYLFAFAGSLSCTSVAKPSFRIARMTIHVMSISHQRCPWTASL